VRGLCALFFVIIVIPIFFTKQKMSSNQVKGKIIKQVGEWDNHPIMAWVYEGAYVRYFPRQEEGQYDVDIFQLLEDLLYKAYH
jgi:hypothetical protein